MDAACITVAAAHKKMLTTMAAGMQQGEAGWQQLQDVDEDAVIAAKCNMLATTQFKPLPNVMSMREW